MAETSRKINYPTPEGERIMWELEQQVEELVNKYIEESEAVCVNADQVGLDYR